MNSNSKLPAGSLKWAVLTLIIVCSLAISWTTCRPEFYSYKAKPRIQSADVAVESPIAIEPKCGYVKTFEESTSIEYSFSIKNTGSRTTRIRKIAPSCSCTAGRLKTDTIAPGETVEFSVRYEVASHFGELPERKILLTTDDPNCSELTCTVGGFRQRRFTIEPATIDWGVVTKGQSRKQHVVVTSHGSDIRLVPSRAFVSCPAIGVRVVSQESLPEATDFLLSVELAENAPVGPFDGHIFIPRQQDDGIGPVIRYRGEVSGPIKAVPRKSFLGLLNPGDKATRTVEVQPLNEVSGSRSPHGIKITGFRDIPHGITIDRHASNCCAFQMTAIASEMDKGSLNQSIVVECEWNDEKYEVMVGVIALVKSPR